MTDTRLSNYRSLVRLLGLGFHPDTRCRNYVNDDGSPTFTYEQAKKYDAVVTAAFEVCDPYETAIEVWEEMGLTD
jgi:hypothetical protein